MSITFKANLINDCYVVEEADDFFLPLPEIINGHDVVVIHPKQILIEGYNFIFDRDDKCWNPLDCIPDSQQLPKYKYFYPVNQKKHTNDTDDTNLDVDINEFIKRSTGVVGDVDDGYDLIFKRLTQNI